MTKTTIIESVGIIGCGWLGKALAHHLKAQQVNVIGSCTSPQAQCQLSDLAIASEILTLPTNAKTLKRSAIFQQKNIVICLPPQLKDGASIYADKIANIVNGAQQAKVSKLILISSTAVYKTLSGHINETAKLNIDDSKVQALTKAESVVNSFNGYSSVVRLGGLIGDKRHPGRFLAGKQGLANGENRVNLIHQLDAVGIIIALLSQPQAVGTFNGVSSTNSSRKTFYQLAAKALQLPVPQFTSELNKLSQQSANQIITNSKVSRQLGYHFIYPNLLTTL